MELGHGDVAKQARLQPKKADPLLPQDLLSVCPVVVTALLLLSRAISEALGLPTPDVAQILAATKASRSSAYETMGMLAALLPTLARKRGRPPKASPPADAEPASEASKLTSAVLVYVTRHPGCVHRNPTRQHYSDGFRSFLLEQRATYAALDVEAFAAAAQVPLGTLKDWLRDPTSPAPDAEPAETASPAPPAATSATDLVHIETVLDAWSRWEGTFLDFCTHVQSHLHVPFGRAFVAHVLEACGVRLPRRRGDARADAIATRGSFQTFFPGAQWVGDGMQLPVVVDGQRINVNLELNVDAYSGAFVGVSVRDTEDSAAVVEALAHGVEETGNSPIALLLDNRPSNHTPEVDEALGDTIRIRATPERPENKAHVEGAFGLLSRVLPKLVMSTQNGTLDLARTVAALVVLTWTRSMNHRPRADRQGRSRAELYSDKPSPEQVQEARQKLRDIARRQERARLTLEARRRPEILALIDEHFARLELLDPERHVRIAIAAYPADAILAGIALFDGKLRAATLPDGVDARYLLGIVRNIAAQREGELTARALLELRLEANDRMLAALVATREDLLAGTDKTAVSHELIARALATHSPLERPFWLDALADLLRPLALDEQRERFLAAARRIHATFAVPVRERQHAVRILAERLFPLAA